MTETKKYYLLVKEIPNWGGGGDEPQIPNDEIWYTSSDGNVILPNSDSGYGANIVSNTYSDGKGIIKFDGNVTSIGARAFSYRIDFTSFIIPNSVTSIGTGAFGYCTGITSVKVEAVTPPSANSNIFNGCSSLTEILVPSASVNAYKSATNWSTYADKIKGY